ncbi:ankyrin domain protein [Botrytis cinerea]
MDIKPTKELIYAVAVIVVAMLYFAFTKTPNAKITKINPPPEKPRCLRILEIPLDVTRTDLEADLKSIIFIPGLGSHPIGSFKAKYKDYVWIRDSLPKDIPSARVLVYGYDTSILDGNAKHSIPDLAKEFLSSINAFRTATKTSQRPIVFVAHSLGALSIARRGKREPKNNDFFRSSYALMFFGVPNLGLKNTSLREIVIGQLNEQLINDLHMDNESEPTPFLRTLGQNFIQCCEEQVFQIRSYYEKKMTKMVRIDNGKISKDGQLCYMVTQESACRIGLTDNSHREEPLLRDHSDLVKFSSQSDNDYGRILDGLQDFVITAPDIVGNRFASVMKLSSAEKRHWDDLNIPPYGNFKETKKVRTAVEGTLQWLVTDQPLEFQDHPERLQKSDFIEWRDSNQSCVLLITGTPGQGKSVLSNFVIDHLQEQQKPQNKIIYYFCNIKNDEKYWTASSILRSFIVQLCEDQRLYHKLPNRFQNKDEKEEFFAESLDNLWSVFLDLIKIDIYTCIYFIIDGLDVYGKEVKSLLLYLKEHLDIQHTEQPLLKLLCTSRPEGYVMDVKFSPKRILRTPQEDLSLFITSELSLFEEDEGFTDNMKEIITEAIQADEKTFLWISVLLRELRNLKSPSLEDIENTIEQLPLELDKLYTSLVQKLLTNPKYGVILAWITYAARPLHFRELEDALAVGMTKGAKSLKDCEKKRITLNSKFIQKNLGSLIDVIGPNPFLIHQTLRDFLKSSGILEKAEIMNQFERPGMLLANTCISYLNFEDIIEFSLSTPEDEDCFLSYAANFWYEHINTLEEAQNNLEQLKCLSSAKGQAIWLPSNTRYSSRYGEIPVSIWTLAIIINKEWFARLLTNTIPSRITEELGDHYILPAAKSSINVFRELLNGLYSARVSITKEVIEAAARNNENGEEMLELLFEERGAEVMITEEVVKAAAGNWRSGKEVMMLLFEERGAEVIITEEVVKAAAGNWSSGKEVMMLLFEERGAELMITEEVMKAAVGNWSSGKEIMKLLFEKRGAEVMITEEVVKAAAGNWYGKEMMMLLLEKRGAEVMITKEVVKAAAGNWSSGKEVMMLLLEKRGAEVMITEEVMKAAAGNRDSGKEVMMLLFEERGAEVMITEEVMKAAAGNGGSGKEVMMLLLEKRGAEVAITKEVVELIIGLFDKEVMMLLLEKRGAEVVITEEVVELIADRFDEKVITLLFEKQKADIAITKEVIKAAATNG